MPASVSPPRKACTRPLAGAPVVALADRVHGDQVHVAEQACTEPDERRKLPGRVVQPVDECILERGAPTGALGVALQCVSQKGQGCVRREGIS
jgi:hypothetical protein